MKRYDESIRVYGAVNTEVYMRKVNVPYIAFHSSIHSDCLATKQNRYRKYTIDFTRISEDTAGQLRSAQSYYLPSTLGVQL